MLVGKNLIVRTEVHGRYRTVGAVCLTVLFCCVALPSISTAYVRLNVEQFATLGNKRFIEVHQECPSLFIHRPEIVLQILKERTVEIGSLQSVPMLMLPVQMVRYAYILHETFAMRREVTLIDRYAEVKFTVRGIYGTPVTYCLLVEVLPLFNENWFALHEVGEPIYWWQV